MFLSDEKNILQTRKCFPLFLNVLKALKKAEVSLQQHAIPSITSVYNM